MAIYLIDYENVYIEGLQGIEQLGSEDRVHIFYTQNRCGLTFGLYEQLLSCAAQVKLNEVSLSPKNGDPVKNALDIQLMMYTGYLIGTKQTDAIYIVSRDKDFLLGAEFFQSFIHDDAIALRQVSSIEEALRQDEAPSEEEAPFDDLLPEEPEAETPPEGYVSFVQALRTPDPAGFAAFVDRFARDDAPAATAADAPALLDELSDEEAAAELPLYGRIVLDDIKVPAPAKTSHDSPRFAVQFTDTVRELLGKGADAATVGDVCEIISSSETLVDLNNGLARYYRDGDGERAKTLYHKCKPRFDDLRRLARPGHARNKG